MKFALSALGPGFVGLFNGVQNATYATNGLVPANLEAYVFSVANGASGDTDYVLTYKTRVLAAAVILTAAGDPANTYTIKNAGNAITNAITPGAADTTFALCSEINDANYEIAAGGTLRISHVRTGGSSAALVVVLGIKVA